MTVQVETLEKLQRRITLTLPVTSISGEVQTRLKKLARTVKADGFRPGKVPMSVVAQRYALAVGPAASCAARRAWPASRRAAPAGGRRRSR